MCSTICSSFNPTDAGVDLPRTQFEVIIHASNTLPMTAPQLAASLASERKRYAMLVKQSGYVAEAS